MNGLMLAPKRRERLADQLYGRILELIVSGGLKEGDKLPSEHQVCRMFEVSRPTVREALLRLHADGLVNTRQGSGTFVRRRPSDQLLSLAKVSDVAGLLRCQEVRIGLEGQAASLAAQRHTPEQLQHIRAALATLRASMAGDGTPARADYGFHHAVASASGNVLFVELLEMLNATMLDGMAVALGITRAGSDERGRRVLEEHEAIVDSIARADPEAASLAMRYHLHRARQRMTQGGDP